MVDVQAYSQYGRKHCEMHWIGLVLTTSVEILSGNLSTVKREQRTKPFSLLLMNPRGVLYLSWISRETEPIRYVCLHICIQIYLLQMSINLSSTYLSSYLSIDWSIYSIIYYLSIESEEKRRLIIGIGSCVVEAEKSHYMLSASYRLRKADCVTWSKSECLSTSW
jgi:hypothetical protein